MATYDVATYEESKYEKSKYEKSKYEKSKYDDSNTEMLSEIANKRESRRNRNSKFHNNLLDNEYKKIFNNITSGKATINSDNSDKFT